MYAYVCMCICIHIFVAVNIKFKSESFEGYESDGFALATLVASAPASFPYTVVVIPTNSNPVSAMNTTDYDDTPIVVTFSPGRTEVDVRVPIVTDSIEEGLETFVLMLEVDVNGVIFPVMPLFAQVNITEQQGICGYIVIFMAIYTRIHTDTYIIY